MALTYSQFDTTPLNLIADLKAAIIASTDWEDISYTSGGVNTTQTTSLAANATTVVVASTTGMVIGQTLVFEPGTVREEYRNVNAIASGTNFTVTALTYAHASGSVVREASNLLKATTTRGAQMVVELTDAPMVLNALGVAFWRTHTGAAGGGVDKTGTRYVSWRTNITGGSWAMPLHVTVSASKEHLFVSIEGPRGWETGASHASYGSVKTYLFMSDLVPYHVEDTTPAVIAGASSLATGVASALNGSSLCFVSRNAANTTSWTSGRLASLQFPTSGVADSTGLALQCTIDGDRYLLPYVFFDEVEGIRGRLARIFFAGSTKLSALGGTPPPVGEDITFDGVTYRLTAVNSADGSASTYWGPLGATENSSADAAASTVAAIPVA